MEKLRYVLDHIDEILLSLTRGLDPTILSRGYGEEHGVMRSYQATTPVLGMVLPSNSPGVHSLWLPIIPLQIGLVLQAGSAGTVDPVARDPGVLRGWGTPRGDLRVPGTRGGRGRSPQPLPAQFDLRWHGDRRAVCRQPERAGAWARVQQDTDGRRRRRRLGAVFESDGRQRAGQQRPRMHQLLRHLGVAAYERDRHGPGRSAGSSAPAAAGEPGGGAGRVHGTWPSQGDLCRHRTASSRNLVSRR